MKCCCTQYKWIFYCNIWYFGGKQICCQSFYWYIYIYIYIRYKKTTMRNCTDLCKLVEQLLSQILTSRLVSLYSRKITIRWADWNEIGTFRLPRGGMFWLLYRRTAKSWVWFRSIQNFYFAGSSSFFSFRLLVSWNNKHCSLGTAVNEWPTHLLGIMSFQSYHVPQKYNTRTHFPWIPSLPVSLRLLC